MDRPALFHIVHPSPQNDYLGSDIHIIVTQTPDPMKTSIFITTEFHQAAVGLRTRRAMAHSRTVTAQAIRDAADCHDLPVGLCAQVHHGHTLMNPQLAYDTDDGDHFWIFTISRNDQPEQIPGSPSISPTMSFDIEDDADHSISLLQMHHIRRPGSKSQAFQQQCQDLHQALERLCELLQHGTCQATPPPQEALTYSQQALQSHDKVVLSLQTQLCVSRMFQEQQQFHMLLEEPDWLKSFQAPWISPLGHIPEHARLHPATWEALHEAPTSSLPLGTIELYIDGATQGDQAGWSVVLVYHDGHTSSLQGVLAGPVQVCPHQPDWIGATSTTNITAEFTALIVAEALALSLPAKVIIRPDLQLSQQLVNGQVMLHQVPTLARIAVSLANLAPHHFEVQEVRAHQGHPWNELADATAKSAAFTQSTTGDIPWAKLHALASQTHEAGWNWLQHAATHLQQAFPLLHHHQVIQLHEPQLYERTEAPDHSSQADTTYGHLHWKMVSFNVLALGEDDAPILSNRVLRLDHQLHQANVLFAGLQETRTDQGMRTTEHYAILASGGDGHSRKQYLGCELWVHRAMPIYDDGNGTKYTFNDFKPIVQCANPRMLIVQFTGPIQFTIAVAHAPCLSSTNPLQEVEQWWQSLAALINQSRHTQFYLLCDANAPLATAETDSFGLYGAEPSNDQGECFEAFMLATQMAAPCTLGAHTGPQGTWRHPRGHWLRRDYVLVPQSMVPMVKSTQILPDFT